MFLRPIDLIERGALHGKQVSSLSVELDPSWLPLRTTHGDIVRGDAENYENPIGEASERFQVLEQPFAVVAAIDSDLRRSRVSTIQLRNTLEVAMDF